MTVTNDAVFNQPIFNYTRDFPFIWEEMILPIGFRADRERAEGILLEAARRHAVRVEDLSEATQEHLAQRYHLHRADFEPKVYWRLTDNWLELTVRIITRDHGIRVVKDAMSRDVLRALDAAGIGIASATYEIVGLPPLEIRGGTPLGAAAHPSS